MKRKLGNIAAGLLILTLLCSCWGTTASCEAKTRKPWVNAYKKIIRQLEKDYCDLEETLTYQLIYFNDDNVPELVAGITDYWVSMYTYDHGKVYTVMEQWGYGMGGNTGYYYLPKKNLLVNYNSDFAGDRFYNYYGKMKNHEIVDYYKKTLRMDRFIDKNKDGMPQENEYLKDDQWVYYYGDKRISEKKFNSLCFDGETEYICGEYSMKEILKKLGK